MKRKLNKVLLAVVFIICMGGVVYARDNTALISIDDDMLLAEISMLQNVEVNSRSLSLNVNYAEREYFESYYVVTSSTIIYEPIRPRFGCGLFNWVTLSDTGWVHQSGNFYIRIIIRQQVCPHGCGRGDVEMLEMGMWL